MTDNYQYGQCANFIKERTSLKEDSLEKLEEIVMDSAKAQAILDAARMSMGKFLYCEGFSSYSYKISLWTSVALILKYKLLL